MSAPNQTYGEQLAQAVREWKRARALADEAFQESEERRKFYEQALSVAAGAFRALDELIRKNEE